MNTSQTRRSEKPAVYDLLSAGHRRFSCAQEYPETQSLTKTNLGSFRAIALSSSAERVAAQAVGRSAAAFFPAMYPWTVQRPSPCWLKPPADSPPQYRPGITWLCMSVT